MKMAKPSERDIDAAGNLMSLLLQLDRGDYPSLDDSADVPDWFDEDNPEHLRAFYDAVKGTVDRAPGYPGRVIGGMCYVIMYDKNEIIDPDSDVIELHPKLAKALEFADSALAAAEPTETQSAPDSAPNASAEHSDKAAVADAGGLTEAQREKQAADLRADLAALQSFVNDLDDGSASRAFYSVRGAVIAQLHDDRVPATSAGGRNG